MHTINMQNSKDAGAAQSPNAEDDLRWVELGIDYLFHAYEKVPAARMVLSGLSDRVSVRSGGFRSVSFWDLT